MANSDKNIVITPNKGEVATPTIVFTGGSNTPGTLTVNDAGTLTFDKQLISSVATGTAPFAVSSTTRVTNLNVATAGNADTVTNGVYTTGDQTIGGTKTFSSTITGSISGNAGTVTNGVYQNAYGSFQVSFTSNIDANVNRNAGMYGSYAAAATNTPTVSGLLWNATSGAAGAGDGAQIWQDYVTNNLYARQRWGGSYGAWLTILSSNNYNTFAQKKIVIQDAAPAGAASDLWWDSDAGTLSIYYGGAWVEVNPSLGTTSNPQFNSMGVGAAASGVAGKILSAGMTAWNTTTPGLTTGNIQIGTASATTDAGGAITFAARDGGGGVNAQAGIYIASGGGFGTRMYIATTNSYVTGSITAMSINENGLVAITRSGLTAAGDVTAYSSDIRLKTNIKPIENSLEKVHLLLGATFDWIENITDLGFNPTHKTNDSGLLAQQVQTAFPQAVAFAPFDRDDENNSKSGEDYLTVKYEKLVPLLIEAIKEVDTKYQNIINDLKNEIKALKGVE